MLPQKWFYRYRFATQPFPVIDQSQVNFVQNKALIAATQLFR
jgi:hypothetical protein